MTVVLEDEFNHFVTHFGICDVLVGPSSFGNINHWPRLAREFTQMTQYQEDMEQLLIDFLPVKLMNIVCELDCFIISIIGYYYGRGYNPNIMNALEIALKYNQIVFVRELLCLTFIPFNEIRTKKKAIKYAINFLQSKQAGLDLNVSSMSDNTIDIVKHSIAAVGFGKRRLLIDMTKGRSFLRKALDIACIIVDYVTPSDIKYNYIGSQIAQSSYLFPLKTANVPVIIQTWTNCVDEYMINEAVVWEYILPTLISKTESWKNVTDEELNGPVMYALDLLNGKLLVEVMCPKYGIFRCNVFDIVNMLLFYGIDLNRDRLKSFTLVLPNKITRLSVNANYNIVSRIFKKFI